MSFALSSHYEVFYKLSQIEISESKDQFSGIL